MTPATGPRVALVRGSADVRHDGVADYVAHLATALRAAGVAVHVLDAADLPREVDADLVHVQFSPSAFGDRDPAWLAAVLRSGRPLVTTMHEQGWPAELAAAADAVVVTNETHARACTGPVTTIPLAPNVSCAVNDRAAGGGAGGAGPVLAFFGYVHPVKGVRYLMEAVALLRSRYPAVRALVVGGFTSLSLPRAEAEAFRAELTATADRLGVADRVRFTGYLSAPDASAALATADVGVLPFTHGVTTKSGALLTLLAHGLPTIVTPARPPDPELVDGRIAYVARRVRDGAAIADAVAGVLSRPAARDRLAGEGGRFAREHSWARVAADHVALYDRVLGRG